MGEPMTDEQLAEQRRQRDYTRERGIGGWPFNYAFVSTLHAQAVDEIDRLRADNERLTAALDTIANDSDTAYMACSDLPACSGDSFKPETHNKECAVRIAYDALNPEPTS